MTDGKLRNGEEGKRNHSPANEVPISRQFIDLEVQIWPPAINQKAKVNTCREQHVGNRFVKVAPGLSHQSVGLRKCLLLLLFEFAVMEFNQCDTGNFENSYVRNPWRNWNFKLLFAVLPTGGENFPSINWKLISNDMQNKQWNGSRICQRAAKVCVRPPLCQTWLSFTNIMPWLAKGPTEMGD